VLAQGLLFFWNLGRWKSIKGKSEQREKNQLSETIERGNAFNGLPRILPKTRLFFHINEYKSTIYCYIGLPGEAVSCAYFVQEGGVFNGVIITC